MMSSSVLLRKVRSSATKLLSALVLLSLLPGPVAYGQGSRTAAPVPVVTPSPDGPRVEPALQAVDDKYTTGLGVLLSVSAPGLLGNDVGSSLTAVKDSDPSHGTLNSFGSDGSFEYAPNTGFLGQDTFTYHAIEGESSSNTASPGVLSERG